MHNHQQELKKIVEKYAHLTEEGEYVCNEGVTFDAVENDFIAWLSENLTAAGLDSVKIKRHFTRLSLLLHPDKAFAYTKEIQWLEGYLSKQGESPGACFKLLEFCKERLIASTDASHKPFAHIEKMSDLLQTFENLKENAVTSTQRQMFESLIACAKEYDTYQDDVKAVQSQLLKVILHVLPLLYAGPLISIFHTELTALYGLCLCATTLGAGMKKSNLYPIQLFGNHLQNVGSCAGDVASTVIFRLLEVSIWVGNKSLYTALDSSTYLLTSFNASTPSSNLELRAIFKTGELKLLASAFEEYLDKTKEQYLGQYRAGSKKREKALGFLAELQLIDNKPCSLQEKLTFAKGGLKKLSANGEINTPNGAMASTLQKSNEVLELLLISPEDIVDNAQSCGAQFSG